MKSLKINSRLLSQASSEMPKAPEDGAFTRIEIQQMLNMSKHQAARFIKKAVEMGLCKSIGERDIIGMDNRIYKSPTYTFKDIL